MKLVSTTVLAKECIRLVLVSLSTLLISTGVYAQPSNDNCGGAITLAAGNTCNPISGTTANATQSQPGSIGSANDDVWYSFVANATSLSVNVTGSSTFNAVVQVYSGSCGGSSLAVANNTGNGGTEIITLNNLFVGITYWVRVHHYLATISSNPTFNICVSAPVVEPPCNPNSEEPANSMNPLAAVPKICQVNGFCGTTQGYHATPGATSLTPYSVNTWPELTSAFCGSIENNSFFRFTASSATVQLRVFGSCTSGTGIQMLAFSLNNPNQAFGSGPVTSYGCFSPLTLNPSPTSGIAMSFSGMTPGQTYYVMVDGFSGAICNYKIAADFGVQVSTNISSSQSAICLGNQVTLTASGGNGTYNWQANPDLSATTGASVVATPSTLGTAQYIVSSSSPDPDCPATNDTVSIQVSTVPTPNAGIDDSVCLGDLIYLNGAVSQSNNAKLWQYSAPAGQNPTVSFSPNYSILNPTVTVNAPGVYSFILRETSSLCGQYRDTVRVLVIEPSQVATAVAPSCYGLQDGTITVINQFADEYSFDNGLTWVTTNTQSGFASGTFDVCSRNYLGCSTCTQVTVPDGVQMGLNVSNDTIICENGTATLSGVGTGGTGIQYHWAHTTDMSGTQLVNPTVRSYYPVYASNQDGCLSATDSILVDMFNPISGQISPDAAICPGDYTSLVASASEGQGGSYNFMWSDGFSGSGASNTNSVSPASTTQYSVTITDNCESSPLVLTVNVDVSPVPQPSFSALEDSVCEPALFTVYNTTNPASLQSVMWELSNGEIFTNMDSINPSALSHGQYDLTLTVISPDGCTNTTLVQDFLHAMVKPVSNFRFSPNPVTMFNTKVDFSNLSDNGAMTYLWSFEGVNPGTSTLDNPVILFPDGQVANYLVSLESFTDFGCSDTMYQTVEVRSEVIAYVPNTFTPDHDQFNQTWKFHLDGIDPYEFEVQVMDRWGHLVWQAHDVNAEWDGTSHGEVVPTGAYSWIIKAKDAISTQTYTWTGQVNVLK